MPGTERFIQVPGLWEDALPRFVESLEESARTLRDIAFLCRTGAAIGHHVVDRMEKEGVKAKIRAEMIRNMLKDQRPHAAPPIPG